MVALRQRRLPAAGGDWTSALALFVHAAGFSFACVSLCAANGALLLFCVVQTTMIAWGPWRAERLHALQWVGQATACGGLALLLAGLATPSHAARPPLSASLAEGICPPEMKFNVWL